MTTPDRAFHLTAHAPLVGLSTSPEAGPWGGAPRWGPGVGPWGGWGPGVGPWGGALGWGPGVGPWVGVLRWGPGVGPWGLAQPGPTPAALRGGGSTRESQQEG